MLLQYRQLGLELGLGLGLKGDLDLKSELKVELELKSKSSCECGGANVRCAQCSGRPIKVNGEVGVGIVMVPFDYYGLHSTWCTLTCAIAQNDIDSASATATAVALND